MEKDIDRVQKSADTDIVIRIDDFGGRRGVTIREFVKSERYTGFTKNGTRIPADKFKIFKAAINSIDENDLEGEASETPVDMQAGSKVQSSLGSDLKKKKKQVELNDDEMAM